METGEFIGMLKMNRSRLRIFGHCIAVLVFLVGISIPSFCLSAEDITVETSVDKQEITIGDPISLTVKITRPAGTNMIEGRPLTDLRPFEITGSRLGEEISENGQILTEDVYRISLYETGEFEIPQFSITVSGPNDETVEVKSSRSYPVKVVPVINNMEEVQDIQDIKAPVIIGDFWWQRVLPWATGALLFVILALALLYWWRRKERPAPVVPPAPARPAHEVALEALEQLRADRDGIIANREFEVFSVRASLIIRTYLLDRYGFDARDRTTDEILDHLKKLNLPEKIQKKFQEFLEDCDLVKFAQEALEEKDMHYLIDLGRELVEKTKEQPTIENQALREGDSKTPGVSSMNNNNTPEDGE
jgi:hypothetical protein